MLPKTSLPSFAALCIAASACGSSHESVSPAPLPQDASSELVADAAEGDAPTEAGGGGSPCVKQGGTCVTGVQSSSPPGFLVTCPPGSLLADGNQQMLDGGMDIINSNLGFGCPKNADGSTWPRLCCFPSDSGAAETGD